MPLLPAFRPTLIAALFFLGIAAAPGHSPHDHIELFALSPQFEKDRTMLIVVRQHLFRSNDGGKSWKRLVNGLNVRSPYLSLAAAESESGPVFYAGTEKDGLYQSDDLGQSWNRVAGLPSKKIEALEGCAGDIAAFGGKGTWLHAKAGSAEWHAAKDGHPSDVVATASAQPPGGGPAHFVAADQTGALYYSADGGASWGSFPHPRDGANVTCLALAILPDGSEHLYVGTDGDGIFRTADGGKSFAPANSGLDEKSVVGITASPHYATDGCLYAATWQNGVYRSTDRGESWALESDGLTKHIQADTRKVPHFYTVRLPGGFDGEKPVYLGAYDGLFESTNGGETWAERPTLGLDVLIDLAISPDYANDETLMFSTYWFGAMLSHDAGKTWKPLHPQTEFDPDDPKKIIRVHCISFSPDYARDHTLFTGIRNELLRSTDDGESWESTSLMKLAGKDDVIVDRIAFSPGYAEDGTLFMGGRTGIAKTRRGAIFKSTDRGRTFTLVHELDEMYLHALTISPDYLNDGTVFASGGDGSCFLYRTTDAGKSWANITGTIQVVRDEGMELAISPDYAADHTLFAGTGRGLFRSADGGESWVERPIADLGDQPYVETLAISPDYARDRMLIAAVRGRGNFVSANGGETFRPQAPALLAENHGMTKMWYYSPGHLIQFSPQFAEDRTLFGFTGESLFRSTDGGENWAALDLSNYQAKLRYLEGFALLIRTDAFRYGAGIGGGALLAALAFFLWRRSQAKRKSAAG